jgi:hypothetical protein
MLLILASHGGFHFHYFLPDVIVVCGSLPQLIDMLAKIGNLHVYASILPPLAFFSLFTSSCGQLV